MRSRSLSNRTVLLIGVALWGYWLTATVCWAQVPQRPEFAKHVEPILQSLCYDCHGNGASEGNMRLDDAESQLELIRNRPLWGKVWENLLSETMPPGDMPQPTETERRTLSRWIGQTVFQLDRSKPDPGRVTIRRLNREEYRYTVLDLLGIDFAVDEHFPAEDTGYGFDTIGDVMTVPPTLMEKYFLAAEEISRQLMDEANRPVEERSRAYQQLFAMAAESPATDRLDRARQIIQRLGTRAYRQPIDTATVEKLINLSQPEFDNGSTSLAELVARACEAILVSPRFIYRAEFQPRPNDPKNVHPLDEYALASRLSYFLWSSLPDEQLLELAAAGKLRQDLRAQVERLLRDPRSSRLVDNFVGQWLQTRDVTGMHRSRQLQDAVRHLREDMQDETHKFFAHIMREDRDVIELITADYSFLNEDLAKFYDVPDVHGSEFRLVRFPDGSPRGGVLTHGSVLLVTSNPDRTSPVKRGLFVLDNILAAPAPPAPPDVPALEDSKRTRDEQITLRDQLERHRDDPSCATCHDRMDPLGLGLENFDAIGRWREEDNGLPIDASSQLASGESFSGIGELREILRQKRRLFYRCLTKKLMTYALGRGIEYTDTPTVENIVDALMTGEGRFSTLLMGVIESPQFQQRRGDDLASRSEQTEPAKVKNALNQPVSAEERVKDTLPSLRSLLKSPR